MILQLRHVIHTIRMLNWAQILALYTTNGLLPTHTAVSSKLDEKVWMEWWTDGHTYIHTVHCKVSDVTTRPRLRYYVSVSP